MHLHKSDCDVLKTLLVIIAVYFALGAVLIAWR